MRGGGMQPRSLIPPSHMNGQENKMLDLISAGFVAVFFVAATSYVALCERI